MTYLLSVYGSKLVRSYDIGHRNFNRKCRPGHTKAIAINFDDVFG